MAYAPPASPPRQSALRVVRITRRDVRIVRVPAEAEGAPCAKLLSVPSFGSRQPIPLPQCGGCFDFIVVDAKTEMRASGAGWSQGVRHQIINRVTVRQSPICHQPGDGQTMRWCRPSAQHLSFTPSLSIISRVFKKN